MFRKAAFSLILIVYLASCDQPNKTETPGADMLPQNIQVVTAEVRKSDHHIEEFIVDNCEGPGKISRKYQTQASVGVSNVIGTSISVITGLEVEIPATAKAALETEIGLTYNTQVQSANSRLDGLEMEVEKGYHTVFETTWQNQEFESMVTYSLSDDNLEAPYTFTILAPNRVVSKNVKCPSSEIITDPSPPTGVDSGLNEDGRFDAAIWKPYIKNLQSKDVKYWNFSDNGFFAIKNGMNITPEAEIQNAQAFGIQASFPKDVEIRFNIQIDKFESETKHRGYIRYGFTEDTGPEKGYLLWHYYDPNKSKTATSLDVGEGSDHHTIGIQANLTATHEVILSMKNSLLTITFNGDPIIENRKISIDNQVFYISYYVPRNSQLVAFITDFEVLEK